MKNNLDITKLHHIHGLWIVIQLTPLFSSNKGLYASKDKVKEVKEKLSSCITGKILPTRNQYACYDL